MDKTIVVFCANEQIDTAHTVDVDGAGEIVLTCECGRFIKLPAGTDAKGLAAYVDAHGKANAGQVSVAAIEAKKAELLESLGI